MSMLQRTFQLVPGLGPWREKDLWARGVLDWDSFPGPDAPVCLNAQMDVRVRERLAQARAALSSRDLATLASMIPGREHWRLYPAFAEDAVFFDIESEGRESPIPTVVSLFHRGGLETYILDKNLDELPEALARHRLWVTFNGSTYDVPILERYFGLRFPKPELHLDLRSIFRRLGFSAGLKTLEDKFGFGRPPHLRGVNGWDAIVLWRAFRREQNLPALRYLVEYNLYDAFQLRSLMDVAYIRATQFLGFEPGIERPFERGDVLYDVSKLLMELCPIDPGEDMLVRLRELHGEPET